LQELGWDSELDELLLAKEDEIEASGDIRLNSYLLRAKGDLEGADKASLEYSASRKVFTSDGRVILLGDDQDEDYLAEDDPGEDLQDGDDGGPQQA